MAAPSPSTNRPERYVTNAPGTTLKVDVSEDLANALVTAFNTGTIAKQSASPLTIDTGIVIASGDRSLLKAVNIVGNIDTIAHLAIKQAGSYIKPSSVGGSPQYPAVASTSINRNEPADLEKLYIYHDSTDADTQWALIFYNTDQNQDGDVDVTLTQEQTTP